MPTEDEYQFYASFKPFKTKMNEIGKRLLDLTQNFLQHDENAKAPILNDSDDVDEVTEKFDEVVDFVDRLIEKVVRLCFCPIHAQHHHNHALHHVDARTALGSHAIAWVVQSPTPMNLTANLFCIIYTQH